MSKLPRVEPVHRRLDKLVIVVLSLIITVFWVILWWQSIRKVPVYSGELHAIGHVDWTTMWTWTDYEGYSRYSPTGLLAVGLVDRYLIAPMLGIPFSEVPSSTFARALRLVPAHILGFVLVAVVTYLLCRTLRFSIPSSFVAGLFFGVNKGFAYYFYFVSTIAASLLVIYACGCLVFWTLYLRARRRVHLIGYYACLLLAVGAWEQWIDLFLFLVIFCAVAAFESRRLDKTLIRHGIVVPFLLLGIYLFFRYPFLRIEASSISEAQSVFSYPAISLMLEDMVANASLHIASLFDPLLFPWPMLSQSVIGRYDMDTFNPYNKQYTQFSTIHYRAFADWYSGVLFAFFVSITIIILQYLRRHQSDRYAAGMGLCLVYAGFAIHLPVMYRTYFILPGVAGLLDYKHPLSILGASILLAWAVEKLWKANRPAKHGRLVRIGLVILLCAWIVFTNYSKVVISYSFPWGVYPW